MSYLPVCPTDFFGGLEEELLGLAQPLLSAEMD